jgi:hypothetical protein
MPYKDLKTGEIRWGGFSDRPSEWPRCGALTRQGERCKQLPVSDASRYRPAPRNGRCRFHGGLSTGPKTPEGRKRVGDAARARYKAWAHAGFPDEWPPRGDDGGGATGGGAGGGG